MSGFEQKMKELVSKMELQNAQEKQQRDQLQRRQGIGNALSMGMRSPTMPEIATKTTPVDIGTGIRRGWEGGAKTGLEGKTQDYKRTLDLFKALSTAQGTEKDPSSVREYQFYTQQETGAGRQPASYDEWYKDVKKAGATSFNLGEKVELEKVKGEEKRKADRIKTAETAYNKAGVAKKLLMKAVGEDPDSVRKEIDKPTVAPVAKPIAKPQFQVGQEETKDGKTYIYSGDNQWQLKR